VRDEGPVVRAAKKKAGDAAYRKANLEKIKAYHRAYYWKNRDHIRTNQNKKTKGCADCGNPIFEESTFCTKCVRLGERNYKWRGGRRLSRGYVVLRSRSIDGRVSEMLEHRLVMEMHLGRKLVSGEIVHHIDGNTQNNAIENLMLFPNHLAHRNFHVREKANDKIK
jgi:hypothetical protein